MALVPELLLKEDLIFEIKIRGGQPAEKVEDMRSQLRGLLSEETEPIWSANLDQAQELDFCKCRLEEWEARAEDWKSEVPTSKDKNRFMARLSHLIRRMKLLAEQSSVTAGEQVMLKEGMLKLEGFIQLLATEIKSTASSSQVIVVSTGPVTQEGVVVTSVASVSTCSVASSMGSGVTSTVYQNNSPLMSATIHGTGPMPPMMPIVSNQAGGVVMHAVGPTSAASYNRLPNPLLPYLQVLPVVDGLNVDNVLAFLAGALQMKEFPGVKDSDLLTILTGYCRPPLAERLRAVWSQGGDFEVFHQEVLNFCVPARMFENLKMQRFYRPQQTGESLSNFVGQVKEARRVLRLPHSEQETIQVVLEGLNPEERSRLALSSIPRSFSELDRWCVQSQNIQFLDSQRGDAVVPRSRVCNPPTVMPVSMTAPEDREGRGRESRRPVVCFRCNKPGHIIRYCPEIRSRRQPGGNGTFEPPKNH